jgi:L-alanine-DL-glutamate epimerase-like enolase superfamily enzyme
MVEDSDLPVQRLDVSAFRVPTSRYVNGSPASNETTVVIVEAEAGGVRGLGYVYADVETAKLIDSVLKRVILNKNAIQVVSAWGSMRNAIRTQAWPVAGSIAIAAVDTCLWDLKARLLRIPLVNLFGVARAEIPVYGATEDQYPWPQLEVQLRDWAADGMPAVKILVGASPDEDLDIVEKASKIAGPNMQLFVDARGAYNSEQAIEKARAFRDLGVVWFEEPVPSNDLEGLRTLRQNKPARMDIAAGREGFDSAYFRKILENGAVDVLKVNATRCAGLTGFLQADSMCQGFKTELSSHAAPSLHAHLCCVAMNARNAEYLSEHARIEQMFFDGALRAGQGRLRPDLTRPGLGLELRVPDLERYRVYGNTASRKSSHTR